MVTAAFTTWRANPAAESGSEADGSWRAAPGLRCADAAALPEGAVTVTAELEAEAGIEPAYTDLQSAA